MKLNEDNRIPYFYTIQDKESGKKYAGAKWGKDANPDKFMQFGGYSTSSETINKILSECENIRFAILDIVLEEDLKIPFGCQSVQEYENWYFQEFDCIADTNWFNLRKISSHGDPHMKKLMMIKYGAPYASQVPEIQKRMQESFNSNHDSKSKAEIRSRAMESTRKTKLSLYGDEYYSNTEKWMETNRQKFGGNSPVSDPQVVQKAKDTCQELYGGNSSMSDPKIVEKRRNNNFAKYGGHPMITEEVKSKRMLSSLAKHGYPSSDKIAYICEHCGRRGTGIGNYKRHHHNRCKSFDGIFREDLIGLILFPKDHNNPFGEM